MKKILEEEEYRREERIINRIFARYNFREDQEQALLDNNYVFLYAIDGKYGEAIWGLEKKREDYNFQILLYLDFINGEYHIYKRKHAHQMGR